MPLTILLSILTVSVAVSAQTSKTPPQAKPKVSTSAQQCLDCHSTSTPGIVEQWRGSARAWARP
jgi:hypothetical protein